METEASGPCQKGGMRLSEALDNMQLAYNPITKQLHFVSPKVDKTREEILDEIDKLSKKSSFSDEGNFSISTCEKSDTSDSPKSTLQWGGSVGHQRGKDGGSFSSTVSSLSECSLGSAASKDDDLPDVAAFHQDEGKLKKKGLSGFFSRGVFPWKNSSSKSQDSTPTTWKLFGSKSQVNLSKNLTCETQKNSLSPASSVANTPHHHRRQGSSASEKQFEDLVASSIALIQHDRPSNLPAKCAEEALRHKEEHARMVEAARRRVEREAAARLARLQQSLRLEERLARHAREWTQNILPHWQTQKNAKRTLELWWSGLPPAIRGRVWQLAIENKLKITHEHYQDLVAKATEKLHEAQMKRKRLKVNRIEGCACKSEAKREDRAKTDDDCRQEEKRISLPRNYSEQNLKSHTTEEVKCCSKSNPNLLEYSDECSMELIQLDIARTFPHLCIFQPGGPYFNVLYQLLSAYVCYRPDIGYIQGMSFIAAVLILNMEAPQAFVCFANLLDGPVFRAAFTRDGAAMQRLWKAYTTLLRHNLPTLADTVAPELYLLEWLYTAFAKAMPLDATCRVWDVFLRDGDTFLFNTALGVLHLYQEELKDMDFISAAQFLTKLPEDLDPEALFKSISSVAMSLDGMSFEELASACNDSSLDDDDNDIRGVFPWKNSSSKSQDSTPTTWKLFGSKSQVNLSKNLTCETQKNSLSPASSVANTPHHHRRQGSSASEKQFEDLVASSIALIQHDRPSNLPAKCAEEALRHKEEHARMVEAARRRVEREAAARLARLQQSLRLEERLARHAREWTQNILPHWQTQKNAKRTLELWWSGLPPAIRGRVWQLAIENKLKITHDHYQDLVAKATEKLHEAQMKRKRLKVNRIEGCACKSEAKREDRAKTDDDCRQEEKRISLPRNYSEQNLKSHTTEEVKCCSKSNPNLLEYSDECSMELIQLDIARTFPHLCIFQPGGPYFNVLYQLLSAYVCYRPDIGYIQGMSFIAAVLILNMEAPQAFVCFANLLDGPVFRAAFTRDGAAMQRLWKAYTTLLRHNLPTLADTVAPELYLLEWLYTAFAKAMPLDATCRVWDVFLRDGDTFLFNTALGVLHLYQEELKDMDFISAAQFLTKLPEDLDPEALFKSISSVAMSLDGMSFEELASACNDSSLDDDDNDIRL